MDHISLPDSSAQEFLKQLETGKSTMSTSNYAAASELFQKALLDFQNAVSEEWAECNRLLGVALMHLCNFDDAKGYLEKALIWYRENKGEDAPESLGCSYDHAELLFRDMDYEEAQTELEKMIPLLSVKDPKPNDEIIRAVRLLAEGLNESGDPGKARDMIKKSLEISPKCGDLLRYDLAVFECIEGHEDTAIVLILAFTEDHPEKFPIVVADKKLAPIASRLQSLKYGGCYDGSAP